MRILVGLLACLLLLACESKAPESETVARVDGDAITQAQWNAAVHELERSAGVSLDEAGRRKVLESLVQSRLMANHAEDMLHEDEMAELEARAALQRERLLVKEYLRRSADPSPVTEERIQAFYAQNRELFGATQTRRFELLTTERAPASSQRKAVMDAMQAVRERQNWKGIAALDGVRWVHRLENDRNDALDSRVRSAAGAMSEGETSEILFVGGRPYLIRVTAVEQVEAKPLPSVRADIMRRLQIEQLQQSIDKAGEDLLSEAEVEYLVPNE